MGNRTTSCSFSYMYFMHSPTRPAIWRKSDDIKMLITFLFSSFGSYLSLTYFMSQSKILTSQCTLISRSSEESVSVKNCSKYFISFRRIDFLQVKSFSIFLFSSVTCINMSSSLLTELLATSCSFFSG